MQHVDYGSDKWIKIYTTMEFYQKNYKAGTSSTAVQKNWWILRNDVENIMSNAARKYPWSNEMHTSYSLSGSILYYHHRTLCMVGAIVADTSQKHPVNIKSIEMFHILLTFWNVNHVFMSEILRSCTSK